MLHSGNGDDGANTSVRIDAPLREGSAQSEWRARYKSYLALAAQADTEYRAFVEHRARFIGLTEDILRLGDTLFAECTGSAVYDALDKAKTMPNLIEVLHEKVTSSLAG